MKKFSLLLLCIAFSHVNAGLINWTSSILTGTNTGGLAVGNLVAMYIDVNNDSVLDGGLSVNTDFTVNVAGSDADLQDDSFAGFSSTIVDLVTAVPAVSPGIDTKPDIDVLPDNSFVYTVIFDSSTLSSSSLGLIADATTFNVGSVNPPATAVDYIADDGSGNLALSMGSVTVIPEPSTLVLIAISLARILGVRRFSRK